MKNKLIFGLLALGSVSVLCGFDSTKSASDILTQVKENSAAVESMSSDLIFNCDVSIDLSDSASDSSTSISVVAGADFDLQTTTDPVAAALTGEVSISTFGLSEEIITMELYMVENDGMLDTYLYTEDSASDEEGQGSWEYGSTDSSSLQSLLDLSSSLDFNALSDWGLDFSVASEAADYDGTECYLLSAGLEASSLTTALEKLEELSGEELTEDEDVSYLLDLLDGLKVDVEYYIDAASYLPMALHIDLNDSDLTSVNELLTQSLAGEDDSTIVELILNDLSLDFTFSYDDVEEIAVPQDALDAVAAGEAGDLEDTVEDTLDDLT